VTFTFPLINNAANVLFVVTGAEKNSILVDIFRDGKRDVPAANVSSASGIVRWFVDRTAAGELKEKQ
jgi:6-phosphogluconolactonase